MSTSVIKQDEGTELWRAIKVRTEISSFDIYCKFINKILGEGTTIPEHDVMSRAKNSFNQVDAYDLLKCATEVFLLLQCGVLNQIDPGGKLRSAGLISNPTDIYRSIKGNDYDYPPKSLDDIAKELAKYLGNKNQNFIQTILFKLTGDKIPSVADGEIQKILDKMEPIRKDFDPATLDAKEEQKKLIDFKSNFDSAKDSAAKVGVFTSAVAAGKTIVDSKGMDKIEGVLQGIEREFPSISGISDAKTFVAAAKGDLKALGATASKTDDQKVKEISSAISKAEDSIRKSINSFDAVKFEFEAVFGKLKKSISKLEPFSKLPIKPTTIEKWEKLCLPELIWSYWHEEGMLVQTINAISLRFQNLKRGDSADPLAELELDPLWSLNNFLWGYIQDKNNHLTIIRRAYEYDHHYGITLVGKAIPKLRSADSRSKFLEAFHNLLYQCSIFFKEDDNKQVVSDAFPLFNALKQVHLLLAEGAHNQYGDLPWTARAEMLIQQWLLGRPEIQEFLRGRKMIPYSEAWMGTVDAMKRLQGWTNTSVTHFHDLATHGEQLILSIRHGNWSQLISEDAKTWARYWREQIQGYVYAYQIATSVDLTNPNAQYRSEKPSTLLQRQLVTQGGR